MQHLKKNKLADHYTNYNIKTVVNNYQINILWHH